MLNFENAISEAAIYVRVSTDDQADRGTIESQVEYAHKYCDLNNINIMKEYRDDGVTGTLPLQDRPAGHDLLQDAQAGLFSTLLVFKLDRLGRATRVILNAIYDLEKTGVKLKSMTEPFDTGDASGRFLLTILAGVADLERSNILDRMWLGANRAAADGKWLGGIVPYGYFKNDEGYLEINTAEIPGTGMSECDVVKLIYSMVAGKGMTSQAVTDYLNALGIPPAYVAHGIGSKRKKRTNGVWFQGRIVNMVHSTTYKGIHQYGKRASRQREIIERKVPAIISEDVWQRAQETLKSNQILSARNASNIYMLRGLITCGNCGKIYHGADSKRCRYYACGGRRNWKRSPGDKCVSRSITMSWIDDVVWNGCMRYINDPPAAIRSIRENGSDDKEDERAGMLSSQLASCDAERERVIDMYRTNLLTMAELTTQLDKAAAKKAAIQKELTSIQNDRVINNVFAARESAQKFLEIVQKKLSSGELSDELKRNIVLSMVDGITATTTGEGSAATVNIEIRYKFGADVDFTTFASCTGKRVNISTGKIAPLVSNILVYPPDPSKGCTAASRIKYIRWVNHVSIKDFAAATGISAAGISVIENGHSKEITNRVVKKICSVYQVDAWFVAAYDELPAITVPQNLFKGRKYRLYDQSEAATFFGVTTKLYCQWENGRISHAPHAKKIDPDKLKEWCSIFA